MQIKFHNTFTKQYSKLNKQQQKKVDLTIGKFILNPFDKSLRNHKLKGKLKGFRAISAEFDLRLVFNLKDKYMEVVFLYVGTHNQVY